jgi:hypothetical protein
MKIGEFRNAFYLSVLQMLDVVRGRIAKGGSDQVIGLGNTFVEAGCSCNVCVQPQVRFKPRMLVVSSDTAPHFYVESVRLGKCHCLASHAFIPSETFTVDREPSSGKTEISLNLGVAEVSRYVTVVVKNRSDKPQFFRGALVGTEC